MFRKGTLSVGSRKCIASGHTAPSSDGPSKIPAITSPITGGWPRYTQKPPEHLTRQHHRRQGQQDVRESVRLPSRLRGHRGGAGGSISPERE